MSNKDFILDVLVRFDQLEYRPKDGKIELNDFLDAASDTLLHADTLADVKATLDFMSWCYLRWDEIEAAYDDDQRVFAKVPASDNRIIGTVDDSAGVRVLTNCLRGDKKLVNIFMNTNDGATVFAAPLEKGRYSIFNDGDYTLKPALLSKKKMTIVDSRNRSVCDIVLQNDFTFTLEGNRTPYYLFDDGNVITIYETRYLASLPAGQKPDINECLAMIGADIFDSEHKDFGLSRVTIFEDVDTEFVMYLGLAAFLIYTQTAK